ncbi:MAG: hypothetical protein AAFR93_16935, partial [Pseudomonadota bacterium]
KIIHWRCIGKAWMMGRIVRALVVVLGFALSLAPAARTQELCEQAVPCPLGARSYHVKVPDGWDGVSPMPLMLHFHGWARQGTLIVKHARISGATRRLGVLLVAPNGMNGTWSFRQKGSPDIEFARAVIEDVAQRYPVDRDRIIISGYSFGSAAAWRYACTYGGEIYALLAVSGTFWNQDERCETGPTHVRHVHGTSDTVMDFPFGPDGDVTYPVALWRRHNGCAEPGERVGDWAATSRVMFTRYAWRDCAKPVILDVHPRGHFIPRGWIRRQLEELLDLPITPGPDAMR